MPLMFAWLLARPAILVGIGLVALLGVREAQRFFEVRGLRNDIAELQLALDKERTATAEFRVALANVESNRDKLESTIAEMNARLDTLQARARQIESAANLRVARAIRAGEEAAKELRAETTRVPPGHEEMNLWLAGRLGL